MGVKNFDGCYQGLKKLRNNLYIGRKVDRINERFAG